ncbi:retrovirus-related pol polyprotein from transposon TNT 1-94 [Tanacetum coccineum]
MRVVGEVNGKKYIIPGVIVDDYSQFTWVKCLRSKDEAPAFIINFLKMIQVRLKETVRRISTDNGTKFVNQTMQASKTRSWLCHRRHLHLKRGAINHLARHGLVRGLPKLKFEKDHLCSACALGKSSKKPHKPKSEDTNQEKLYLLHMDLCGPMRVASVNGKKEPRSLLSTTTHNLHG